jgi:glutaredoxin-like protein nrdH
LPCYLGGAIDFCATTICASSLIPYRHGTAQVLTKLKGKLKMSNITVYSKPNCMQCEFTKRWLHGNGIPYTSYDVTKDELSLDYIKRLGYQNLPVVVVDDGDKHWFGFRPDLLEELKER